MQVQHAIKAVSSHLFNGLSNWYDIKSKTELESDVEGFYWETVEWKETIQKVVLKSWYETVLVQFKILRLDFNRTKLHYSFKWFVTLFLTALHLRTRAQSALSHLLCEVHKVKKICSYIIWHDIYHMRCLWLILIFFWPLIKLVLNFENKSIERLSPSTNHYHFLSLTPFSLWLFPKYRKWK